MAVAADDLDAPLGQGKTRKQRRVIPLALPQVVLGLLSTFVIVVAGWAMIANDPFGGEPMALASIEPAVAGASRKPEEITIVRPAAAANNAAAGSERPSRYDGPPAETTATPPPPAGKTITIIDGSSGKREQVVIPESREPNAPEKPTEAKLTEVSRHGPLPRIAADGARAADVYARPVKPLAGKPDAPRVAIVVGGLGIGGAATNDALAKLPGAVTLAFAAYADRLEQLSARARNDGHEVLLQVPMEPLDYPDSDPGPRTLLTELDAGQNIDRLHWLLSRMQGYVGITNYMGGRFTASETALTPVLKEANKRGLVYLDDGSSQKSLAGQVAGATNLPFAKADLIIDAVPTPGEIDRALSRLEALARERGLAVGTAGALPGAIDRIAKWAKAAESRGILLVPITAVAVKAKQS
jgi:polysaccharide deacetylase 2 family uncharacterized protein YibQ